MRLIAAAVGLASMLLASEATAQATTYTFTSAPYGAGGGPITNTACTGVGDCATYVAGQRAVITLTFAAPLAPNLPLSDQRNAISYTFSDGVRLTSGPNADAALITAVIATDATGRPNDYLLNVQRTPGPPYNINDPADPNSRASYIFINPVLARSETNLVCVGRHPQAFAAGRCDQFSLLPGYSQAEAQGASTVTISGLAPAAVPTLSEWAMILLGVMLAGAAALTIQRRRAA